MEKRGVGEGRGLPEIDILWWNAESIIGGH
jgi:hypothetical protein